MVMEDFLENKFVKLWVEDDLLCAQYNEDSIINLETAKELVDLRLKFQAGKNYKLLIFISNLHLFTPEAKNYMSTAGCEGVEKAAMVTNSPINILVGNLFIFINKPLIPTRLFKNKEEALKWLNSF